MEININFQGKKIPKENVSYKCLPLIMLDSVLKVKSTILKQSWKNANMK